MQSITINELASSVEKYQNYHYKGCNHDRNPLNQMNNLIQRCHM